MIGILCNKKTRFTSSFIWYFVCSLKTHTIKKKKRTCSVTNSRFILSCSQLFEKLKLQLNVFMFLNIMYSYQHWKEMLHCSGYRAFI